MTTTDGKAYDCETYFPFSMVSELIEILKAKETKFERYCDFNLQLTIPALDSWAYRHEYWGYKCGSKSFLASFLRRAQYAIERRIGKTTYPEFFSRWGHDFPTVVLQHDADQQPYKTVDIMRLERDNGAVSSSYFFKKQNLDPEETYYLPIEDLQELESNGFEVGYHLNAFERTDYDEEKCLELVEDEIEFFDQKFDLRTFVPHGGVPSKDGSKNNQHVPYRGVLRKYPWCYNGKGFSFDHYWSDGEIYLASPGDPREIAEKLQVGERALFLLHPQYYGHELSPRYPETALADEAWWRNLWGL